MRLGITRVFVLGWSSLLLGAWATSGSLWVRNTSPSVPLGLYRLHAVPPTLPRGVLVLLNPPAVLHPWWPAHIALLKPVAGLPGDVLTIQDERFYINTVDYGPVSAEAAGLRLPRVSSPRQVQEGEVCLASTVPKSFDCRYSGPVPQAAVKAMATPLWTWGD